MTSLVKPCNAQRSLQFKSSSTKYDSLRHTAAVDIETAGTETVDRETVTAAAVHGATEETLQQLNNLTVHILMT